MKLLINADDLGYTPIINQSIFQLYSRGRISSTSLLVNMPHSQDAMDKLEAYPNLGVGVHLNLTKGCPVLPPEQIPTLVDLTGEFWRTKNFYIRTITGRIDHIELEAELRAQIKRILDFGIQPTHLDSHSHWHLLPHLRKLVARLAKSYQIPRIRQTALRRSLIPSNFWLATTVREKHPKTELQISDYFFSLHHWMKSKEEPKDLFFSEGLHHLVARQNIILELVTHPGAQHDPDFPPDTLLTRQRQWEYDFLLSERFDEWLNWMDAEIISYKAL